MGSRRNFLAILVAAGAIGGAIYGVGMKGGLPALPGVAQEPVTVTVASAVTKAKWLAAGVAEFKAAGITTADGRPIEIVTSNVLSGDSMLQIAAQTLQPVVWSPGEQTWVDQLAERWNRGHPRPVASAPCQPTVLTPVGLAMWRPMAEALGWPDKPVSMRALIELANDPEGWARYGRPEWGRLRLGHTHPQYSSAGLLFLAQAIYATLGKTTGITPQDIYDPQVEAALRALAQNTAKYGMVTTDLLSNMARGGPAFLHVTSAFEEGTVRFNQERRDELRYPLAFLFPAEGTFWSDQPYCILDGAPWVDAAEAEAAGLFLDFLRGERMQGLASAHYVRPFAGGANPGGGLTVENGTDPAATPVTVPDLDIPSPDVGEAIIDQFLTTKRKATVLVVFDTSGSMKGEPIKTATEATAEFLSRLHPQDRVGLLAFSTGMALVQPLGEVSATGERAQDVTRGLNADGSTNLYGTVCKATRMMADEAARDRARGENRLYGIVLLSDGADTVGEVSETRMFQTCMLSTEGEEGPRIFVISFGQGADLEVLTRLAAESNGAVFAADPTSIGQAYLRISAEQ
ncbi:MAG: substrate-binding domain-containing protein [Gemmobacter sp.]